ncbi:MAG: vWA domain-containing protein [Gammaproteobacteria bacterium]|nr:vWA domain-containing protein [Gammaproteobacteria bacterium]
MLPIQKSVLFLMLLALLLPIRQVFATSEAVSDVRIIIDVSGSMKKNDPNNLRSPAVRMLVGLLPEGEKAGVWTFAKYVNMLVPYREVNDAWRMKAEKQSNKIHSYGLFTNIEQVLNKATVDVKKADPHYRRSVILLSDGLVDISTDDKASQASRQRILASVVPRLKKANIAVHTIALADTSDHDLLRSIALATDGWYEQVDSAEQLQRVFLHLFEKAAQRDTVPLTDNHFKIDSSINQMTLLVFRSTLKPTELVQPDQSRLTQIKSISGVRWHSEGSYDLITIDKPMAGAWYIDADLDPDNRVMVITDLKLQTTDLPNNILIGESFDINANLTEKNKIIVRPDFLKLVDATMREESEVADPIDTDLNPSLNKGIYRSHVGETFQPGRNDVVITMTSPTFERQRRQSINVVATPLKITVEQLKDEVTRTHRITLEPDTSLIKSDNLSIAAMLTARDGSEWPYDVMKQDNNTWQLTLADLQAGEDYSVALQIRGETLKGRSLFLQPDPIKLIEEPEVMPDQTQQEQLALPEAEENVAQEQPEPESVEPEPTDSQPEIIDEMATSVEIVLPTTEPEPELMADEQSDDGSAMSPTRKLVIGNVLIVLLIGVSLLMWRRQRTLNNINPGDTL